jgi:hypothetical protein
MHYPFTKQMTKNGKGVGINLLPSSKDYRLAAYIYPKLSCGQFSANAAWFDVVDGKSMDVILISPHQCPPRILMGICSLEWQTFASGIIIRAKVQEVGQTYFSSVVETDVEHTERPGLCWISIDPTIQWLQTKDDKDCSLFPVKPLSKVVPSNSLKTLYFHSPFEPERILSSRLAYADLPRDQTYLDIYGTRPGRIVLSWIKAFQLKPNHRGDWYIKVGSQERVVQYSNHHCDCGDSHAGERLVTFASCSDNVRGIETDWIAIAPGNFGICGGSGTLSPARPQGQPIFFNIGFQSVPKLFIAVSEIRCNRSHAGHGTDEDGQYLTSQFLIKAEWVTKLSFTPVLETCHFECFEALSFTWIAMAT